jgi:hypothetical protein
MKKLIYRTRTAPLIRPLPSSEYCFFVVDGFWALARHVPAILKTDGLKDSLQTAAKILTPSRAYYIVVKQGRIVSDGWIMFGCCRAYSIGREDHVIGPIHTIQEERGRGLAAAALTSAVCYCLFRGARYVYIDTDENNLASQATIATAAMHIVPEIGG